MLAKQRPVKCPICSQFGSREDMIQEDKRFYHGEYCHPKFVKNRKATRKENEQWDELYQHIIKLHDLVVLPTGNITRLQDLRAGYTMKNGVKVRQWKTGPNFSLMLDAYKLAEDSIKWCIANKLEGSSSVKSVNYCISIMIDKLNEANEYRKNKLEQSQAQARVDVQESRKDQSYLNKNTYNTKKDDLNISDFL